MLLIHSFAHFDSEFLSLLVVVPKHYFHAERCHTIPFIGSVNVKQFL
jgi:hypothetical protein